MCGLTLVPIAVGIPGRKTRPRGILKGRMGASQCGGVDSPALTHSILLFCDKKCSLVTTYCQ